MRHTVNAKTTPDCPICGKPLDGLAEDFTLSNKRDDASYQEDECGYCNAELGFTKISDTEVVIEEI